MRLQRTILAGMKFTAAAWLCGTFSATLIAAESPADPNGAVTTRVATFETGTGERYFAASIQPAADPQLLNQLRSQPATICVVVDTSATQVGEYRNDQISALNGVLAGLRPGDSVQLFAADVSAAALSEVIDSQDSAAIQTALQKLRRRLPLGNTNFATALETARAALVSRPADQVRSLVYIGDGASMETAGNEARIQSLVDALRADRIAVHSLAVGPSKNVELLATLANHTGGEFMLVADQKTNMADQLGKRMGQAAVMSPIWVQSMALPAGLTAVQSKRLPPLRLDRDSVLIGTVTGTGAGSVSIRGDFMGHAVSLSADVAPEPSHPDFAFLPGMVATATPNAGLLLPTAGSGLLREAARVMAVKADELAKAGSIALQQGNRRGAQAVAELALEADPSNPAAQAVKKLSAGGARLVMQNQDDPFGALLDDTAMPDAAAAGEEPAGAVVDPFAEQPAALPAEPAVPAVPPAAGANLDAAPAAAGAFADEAIIVSDDDLLETPSGLLDEVVAPLDEA
ncbi:MAG: VWA domain-containing protein, partial [Planctomycetaceae bacterium]